MFICPSVTPWKAYYPGSVPRNPAVRKFKYDRFNNYRLHDYDQFYLDLPKANSGEDVQWKMLYTFNQMYGSLSLAADQVHKAKESFIPYSSDNFHKYYEYNNVDWHEYVACSCSCKHGHICAIENVDKPDFEECMGQSVCGAVGLRALGPLGLILLSLLVPLYSTHT